MSDTPITEVIATYNSFGNWAGAAFGGGPLGDVLQENNWSVIGGDCGQLVACYNAAFGA